MTLGEFSLPHVSRKPPSTVTTLPIMLLASPASRYMTGSVVTVDGVDQKSWFISVSI